MLQKNSAVAVQQPVAQSPKASGLPHPVQADVGLWGCDYAVSAAPSHRVPLETALPWDRIHPEAPSASGLVLFLSIAM